MAAPEVELGPEQRAKIRDPGMTLFLTVITFGIYNWVWYYRINRELRDYGRRMGDEKLAGTNPVLSVLAVTIGALVLIPAFVSWWRATGRIRRAERIAEVDERISGWIMGISYVTGIVFTITWTVIPPYVQMALNKVWQGLPPAPTQG
jgi:hypothetical protein